MIRPVQNLVSSHAAPPRRTSSVAVPLAAATAALSAGTAIVLTFGHYGAGYAVAAGGVFALVGLALLMAWRRRGPETGRFGPANTVTLFRAVLVALTAGALGQPDGAAGMWPIVAFASAALLLDGVDGWLARRGNCASAFGARFDQETDALLILVLSLLVLQTGKAGAWVLAAGLMRYAFVAAAHVSPRLARALPPSRRRQTICVVQVVALILCLAPVVTPPVSTALAAASVLLLALSFAVDIRWLLEQPGNPQERTGA